MIDKADRWRQVERDMATARFHATQKQHALERHLVEALIQEMARSKTEDFWDRYKERDVLYGQLAELLNVTNRQAEDIVLRFLGTQQEHTL